MMYKVKCADGTSVEMTLESIIDESGQSRELIRRRLNRGIRNRAALMATPDAGRRMNIARMRDRMAAEHDAGHDDAATRRHREGRERSWYGRRISS